ncbi:hypothetical protein DXX93_02865 [Thalassotalea euphylliae]|uniref:DUF3047 domain-containing protein n=1 Tax=Thalassotalea euphylliae TaxID=1655234 RepID=A0A3E0TMG7_9GAMM|nr:hypothetical protein [Thalassotalea euphylliae]REL25593.1 hypothetical protein DXX93_02865 [Thalassotalea euphylliae]
MRNVHKLLLKKVLFIFFCTSCIAIAAQIPVISNTSQLVQFDTRDSYNFYSIYLEVDEIEVALYEQVEDINFDKIYIMMATKQGDGTYSQIKLKINGRAPAYNYFTLVGYEQNNAKTWLYVSLSDGYKEPATLFKARLSLDGNLNDLKKVEIEDYLVGGSWPRIRKLNNGSNAIAYRKAKCCDLGLLIGSDKASYKPQLAYKQKGAMPVIASFADSSMIYTYQRSFPTTNHKKPKYVQKSRLKIYNGENWWPELLVSEMVYEVHDAYPFERLDGKIDLYYSHSGQRNDGQLSLWRRCIDSYGNLGEEQLVVGKEIGNIAKAYPYRKVNGDIVLMFIEQGGDMNQGAIQFMGNLSSDAVCNLTQNLSQ